jgi:hypothetical protein
MAAEFVNAIDPDGNPVKLPAQNAEAAFSDGFRPETVDETKTREETAKFGDRPIAAGAAAFGRGATLGLSDLALSKTGLVESETLKGLQHHNPVASAVGEVAGAVAPMLIPGVGELTAGGLAAKAAAGTAGAAEALGVGKTAARVLGAAAEGGLFGVGSAISEDVLEDGNLDLAGEKLLTHVGLGAVLGGGAAAGGVAIEKALGKAFRRVGAKAAGAADNVADDALEASGELVPGTLRSDAERVAGTAPAAEAASSAAVGGAEQATEGAVRRGFRVPDVEDISDEAIAGAVRRHADTIKGVFERLGLEFPTPEKMVLRDLDITGAQMGKLKAKGVETSAARSILDDPRYVNAKTLDQKLSLIRSKQSEAAEAIGSSVSQFDDLAEAGERLRPLNIANRIDDELIAPLKNGNALNDPMVAQLRKQSQRLRKLDQATGGEGLSFKAAEELKRSFDPFLKWDSQTPGPLQDKLRKLRGIINNEIENSVEEISIRTGSLEPLDAWKAAKRSYGEMAELEKHVANRAAARDGNRYFSLTDYLSGNAGSVIGGGAAIASAMSGEGPDGSSLAFAGAGMLANKWARERLAHVMALYLDKLGSNKTMQVAAKSFASSFRKVESKMAEAAPAAEAGLATVGETALAKTAPAGEAALARTAAPGVAAAVEAAAPGATAPLLAKYGQVLSTAATKGANALFATHMALSQTDPEYQKEIQQAGFQQEDVHAARSGMVKASKIAAIQEAAQEHDRTMDDAVQGFLRGGGRVRISGRITKAEFEKRFGDLSQMVSNPQALIERLQGGATLGGTAPGVASAVASTATKAVQFLYDKAPKNPYANAMPGMERKWEPSGADLSKWGRYAQAVNDPRSVLEDMRKGTVTREAVEALRAVYPQLAADVQTRLTNAIATNKKSLSYQQRIAVATLMGNGIEPTMAPQAVSALQQIHGMAQQQQQRPATTGQRIRVQSSATTSQRIEGK